MRTNEHEWVAFGELLNASEIDKNIKSIVIDYV